MDFDSGSVADVLSDLGQVSVSLWASSLIHGSVKEDVLDPSALRLSC